MRDRPLSLKELFTINSEVIERATDIQNNLREAFEIELSNGVYGLHGAFHEPLLLETELYYNGELLSTYSIFKALRKYKYDYRLIAFHFENLLTRIVSVWEYIYQFINHYLHLGLYDISAKRTLMERAEYDPVFIPEGNGTRVEYKKKSKADYKKIRKRIKSIDLVKKNNIMNYTAGIYEVKDEWNSLLTEIYYNNIEYVKDIRNQIIHQRPAGAKFTIGFDPMFANYSISVNGNGWINFDEVEQEIDLCMEKIKNAVHLIKHIVKNDIFPNRIENAGKKFYLEEVQCKSCGNKFLIPDLLLGTNHKFLKVLICLKCSYEGIELLGNRIETTEINYGTTYSIYFKKMLEQCDKSETI